MSTPAVVAVVGGGASGSLTATQLARAAQAARRSVDLLLVEPAEPGRGVAYSTSDPRHRLNVPARGMSMWPDDPGHFLRWMRRHVDINFSEIGYAPRMHYRQYLRDCLDRELAAADGVRLEHLDTRAVDIRPHGRRIRVSMADGTSRPVDAVVLAVGAGPADSAWAPAALRRSTRYIADPWDAPRTPVNGDIVLVGAGLTMLDMAQSWCREGVRVHVVSRNALMPLAHAVEPQPPVPLADVPEEELSLSQVRRLVLSHVREVQAAGGDWRQAIDGLRPVTQRLWGKLGPADRAASCAPPPGTGTRCAIASTPLCMPGSRLVARRARSSCTRARSWRPRSGPAASMCA